MFTQKIVRRVASKGWFADKHFVEHATERVDIAPRIEALPANLLRRHVGASTFDFTFPTKKFAEDRFGFLGNGEVDELHQTIAIDQDVIGLDVAVHVALAMEVVEGLADLFDDGG